MRCSTESCVIIQPDLYGSNIAMKVKAGYFTANYSGICYDLSQRHQPTTTYTPFISS